jgi:hypothetical protein
MRNQWLWGLVGLVSLSTGALAQKGGDIEKGLMALEDQWLQADKTNNPELLAPLIADKYLSTTSEGKFEDKAKVLAETKSRKYTSAAYEDMKVTVFGDTAIVRGTYKGSGTETSGKPFDERLRWTDTWIKMPNGKWQVIASQYTAVK